MSEYRAAALRLDPAALAAAPASGDAGLVDAVRREAPGFLAEMAPRLPDGAVVAAAVALVEGGAVDADGAAYAFGRWLVARALRVGAPTPPEIGYPFVDLYAVTAAFRPTPYALVTAFLEELSGERADRLPLGPPASFPLPGVGYAGPDRLAALAPEARAARLVLETAAEDGDAAEDWTGDVDEPEDVVQVLAWVEAAAPTGHALTVFVDGDL
ncbi:hypothetical protein [Rubrivirga litoralis]|uniref:Uncharacterized protein n=1 Tax=Rubrivirga litoralis TaxID=3075598 RepID=A0ABU3BVU5_9BACT|nr:hypothetical protein [Rubrivirga sp. F394]MDT0633276.1 hypothetical protein [Rubrivirga sp. F394]